MAACILKEADNQACQPNNKDGYCYVKRQVQSLAALEKITCSLGSILGIGVVYAFFVAYFAGSCIKTQKNRGQHIREKGNCRYAAERYCRHPFLRIAS